MRDGKVLRTKKWKEGVPMIGRVIAGLQNFQGNRAPYFFVQTEMHREGFPNQCQSGGSDTEWILKHFKSLSDLVALSNAYIDGFPSQGIENGFYWIRGCFPQIDTGKYAPDQSPEDCKGIFQRLFRITDQEVSDILVRMEYLLQSDMELAKSELVKFAETLKPRWKEEADNAISKYGLTVYGDKWDGTIKEY